MQILATGRWCRILSTRKPREPCQVTAILNLGGSGGFVKSVAPLFSNCASGAEFCPSTVSIFQLALILRVSFRESKKSGISAPVIATALRRCNVLSLTIFFSTPSLVLPLPLSILASSSDASGGCSVVYLVCFPNCSLVLAARPLG